LANLTSESNDVNDSAECSATIIAKQLDQRRLCFWTLRDERRFATVVPPYLADAYALARWLTSNHADSQDVVQDACLRALHGIGGFADGDARAWVLTIVRRTAYDWLNTNRPAAIVSAEDLEDLKGTQMPEPDAGTAESRLIDREDETFLEKAIAALPAHYRQTLVMRHLHGLTYREIAEGQTKSPRDLHRSHLWCGRRARPASRAADSETLWPSFKHSIGRVLSPRASSAPLSERD
jgi:RNA polymerase sigma factor (sigma-70 family)